MSEFILVKRYKTIFAGNQPAIEFGISTGIIVVSAPARCAALAFEKRVGLAICPNRVPFSNNSQGTADKKNARLPGSLRSRQRWGA
jgi:hypothetical protein